MFLCSGGGGGGGQVRLALGAKETSIQFLNGSYIRDWEAPIYKRRAFFARVNEKMTA